MISKFILLQILEFFSSDHFVLINKTQILSIFLPDFLINVCNSKNLHILPKNLSKSYTTNLNTPFKLKISAQINFTY